MCVYGTKQTLDLKGWIVLKTTMDDSFSVISCLPAAGIQFYCPACLRIVYFHFIPCVVTLMLFLDLVFVFQTIHVTIFHRFLHISSTAWIYIVGNSPKL